MSTSFPGALDALTNPAATDGLTGHAAQHANANDAIEALEAKVGVDNSTDPASLDYRVATLESGGGGGIWGSITGALSDQTDLQAALNGKLSASATTDAIAEGSSNLYFTAARVRDAVLTGLSTATNAVIAATDSVLTAFGKLQAQISGHTSSTANPHSVTKTQVGLGNVDNTADLNKPVSTATQAALALKADLVSPAFTTPDIGVATGTSFNSITGLSSTTPVMDGTAAVGTGVTVARADHVHPTDTTRAPLNSPNFTGTVSAPSNFNATGAALNLQTGGTNRVTIDGNGNVFSVSPNGGLGYGTGAGGTVTQATSKATAVTLNKPCGQITMHPEQMLPGGEVSFAVQNTAVGDGDVPVVSHNSMFFAIGMPYSLSVTYVAAGIFIISLKNMSAVSRSEALVINFAIIKGATS